MSAAVRAHFGRVEDCDRDARCAERLLSTLPRLSPLYSAECRISLAQAALRISALPRARRLLDEAERDLREVAGAAAAHAWLAACKLQADVAAGTSADEADPLTTAELRVLQFLPTHLSFPEIAEHLYVSPNTVKTHIRAVYRKL